MLSRKIPDAPSSDYRSLSLSSSSSLSLSCQKWCVNDSSAVFWRHWIQKWHHLLSDWLTRSPIELSWSAKNIIVCEFLLDILERVSNLSFPLLWMRKCHSREFFPFFPTLRKSVWIFFNLSFSLYDRLNGWIRWTSRNCWKMVWSSILPSDHYKRLRRRQICKVIWNI